MTDTAYPLTIRDDAQFDAVVKTFQYANHWENFDFVYEDKVDVPARLHGFTVVASNDPAEVYGALLQVAPSQAESGGDVDFTGYKLLAKIRLS